MRDLGFGAEDVYEVEPLLVTHNNNGEIEGVKYAQLTTVLVNAIQEQQAQIKQQAEALRLQQAEIEGLKRLLCIHNSGADVCKSVSTQPR